MDHDGDSPPTFSFRPPIVRRRSSSRFMNPVALIVVAFILLLLVVFFFFPPFLSMASQFTKPSSVKKSWDSVNVFLVLFAILCGVLAKRNDDDNVSSSSGGADDGNLLGSVLLGREEYGDGKGFRSSVGGLGTGVSRLRRNGSSYPDLRQESPWETGDYRFRFFDDFGVNLYSSSTPGDVTRSPEFLRHRSRRSEEGKEYSDLKDIPVDTFVATRGSRLSSTPPPPSMVPGPAPVPPSPPPPPVKSSKRRQSFRSVERKEKVEIRREVETEVEKSRFYPPPCKAPPPPPKTNHRSEKQHGKFDRKMSDEKKDITTAIASLYNQSKRKKNQKAINIYDDATSSFPIPATQSPAPPPPPPPPSFFLNIFKKGYKHKPKRIHSASAPLQPPPPPPPSSIFHSLFKTGSKSKRFHSLSDFPQPPLPPPPPSAPEKINSDLFATSKSSPLKSEFRHRRPATMGKPPLPTKADNYVYDRKDYLNSGGESPLNPLPPPLPPFKLPETRFEVRGDFARIRSTHTSACSSPDRETVDLSTSTKEVKSESDGGETFGPTFVPSPDVNIKADSFISRLRDEWRLEKMNSAKESRKLGPGPTPSPGSNTK